MRQRLRGGALHCRLPAATCCMSWWMRRSRSHRRWGQLFWVVGLLQLQCTMPAGVRPSAVRLAAS